MNWKTEILYQLLNHKELIIAIIGISIIAIDSGCIGKRAMNMFRK